MFKPRFELFIHACSYSVTHCRSHHSLSEGTSVSMSLTMYALCGFDETLENKGHRQAASSVPTSYDDSLVCSYPHPPLRKDAPVFALATLSPHIPKLSQWIALPTASITWNLRSIEKIRPSSQKSSWRVPQLGAARRRQSGPSPQGGGPAPGGAPARRC